MEVATTMGVQDSRASDAFSVAIRRQTGSVFLAFRISSTAFGRRSSGLKVEQTLELAAWVYRAVV